MTNPYRKNGIFVEFYHFHQDKSSELQLAGGKHNTVLGYIQISNKLWTENILEEITI